MNSVSLPSGLGAGGRGKEKAPCRYVHFEVDYDGEPGNEVGNPGDPFVELNPKYHPPLNEDFSSNEKGQIPLGLGPTNQTFTRNQVTDSIIPPFQHMS